MRKTAAAQAVQAALAVVLKAVLQPARRRHRGVELELLHLGRFPLQRWIFKLEFDPVGAIAMRAIAPGRES